MYIPINNLQVYYQKLGKGPDLILLHGWKNDVSTWWGVADRLKEHFTLWLIDLPGFGRSDTPKEGYSNLDYAKSINEFIAKLKIRKPTVLGHSVGGRVGIKLSANFPEKVGKLILEDAAGVKPKQDALKPLIYAGAKMVKLLLPNWWGVKERMRRQFYGAIGSDYLSAGEMRSTLTKLLNEDLTPELARIEAETLIIWGESDAVSASSVEMGQLMYRQIKEARIEVIDGVGHFPHLESPERFVYWVENFLIG